MEEPAKQGNAISDLEAKLEKISLETTNQEELQQNKDLYRDLGEAYLDANQPEQATTLFNNLLAKENDDYKALALYELGKIALESNDLALAHQQFAQAIEAGESTDDEKTKAKAQHAYAYTLMQSGNTSPEVKQGFLKNMEEAIAIFRKYKEYENLGKSFMVLTGFTQTNYSISQSIGYYEDFLEKTEAKEETDLLGFIHYTLGMHYEVDENPKESFRHFEQALHFKNKHNINIDLGETYYHLGLLYDEQGNPEKAIEYNVIALRNMLDLTEMSTHVGMAVIYVQTGLDSITNEELKQEANELLVKAQERGLMPEEETGEQMVYNEPQIDEVLEQTREEMEKAEGMELEELKKAYQEHKEKLPEEAVTFAELAYDFLAKLEEGIDRSVFSFLARKKNKARKAELDDACKEAKETLSNLLANEALEQKADVEAWLKKIEEDFEG